MRVFRLIANVAFVAAMPLAAAAQGTVPRVAESYGPPVRVHVNVSLFLPGATDASAEGTKLRELARKTIYEMAAHECRVVELAIAKSCRLESVNVNVNANQQHGPNRVEGITASGGFAMQVTLK